MRGYYQAMLDWNDLRFVLETARNGGTSGAARVLGVNHATVARRITSAEEALGERLFDRLPSGYVPTEAGREAVRTAEAMERLDSELDLKIAARDDRIKGRLRVTAPQLFIQRVLGGILAEFTDAYPEVDLELVATNDTLNLAQREADVAIRFSKDPPETLVGRRFIDQKGAVYATPELIARDLGGEAPLDWVKFAHWPGPPAEIKAVRPNLRVRLTVDDMAAAIGAVRAGIGATRMACFLGDTDPALVRVPGMPRFDYLPLWLLTHADLRHVPRIRTFMDFTAARLGKLRPVFEGDAP
ncbi:MAG: LysR family transcriptional regulator [Cognatishimia sp.]|nr:LysR family transcriptional regulator [Cognatishimia sp.]